MQSNSTNYVAQDVMNHYEAPSSSQNTQENRIPTPMQIYDHLERFVAGQESAKRVLSVAVYNHMKRVEYGELQKSNILMIGPTGSGKTLLAKTLAGFLKLPFAIADTTSLTEAGYIGADVESILSRLLSNANGDINLAQKGIVFIDEIDKIAINKNDNGRDSGAGVQHGLLKLLEGSRVRVPQDETQTFSSDSIMMDTNNILFICGGAFQSLEKIVSARCNSRTIGFRTDSVDDLIDEQAWYKHATTEDLESFGFISEFLGRLPIKLFLNPISKVELIKILTEVEDSIIKDYQKSFSFDNTELIFSKDAISAIADKALEQKSGARGLRGIIEELLLDTAFKAPNIPGKRVVVIDEAVVKSKKSPDIKKCYSEKLSIERF